MELWISAMSFLLAMLLLSTRAGSRAADQAAALAARCCTTPGRAMLSIGILSMIFYAIPSLWHIPSPVVHDEFAYLFQAETFARGRLANPPLEMPRFFETFHVIQSPARSAKFPPAPAMAIMLGVLAGLPILGVWLGIAAALAGLLWMLRAIMPTRWAAILALMALFHPTIIWFSQTYWGGGVAMLGGTLAGGAVLRAMRGCASLSVAMIGGAGISILALSRPFEGALYVAACGAGLLIHAIVRRRLTPALIRFALAALALPALTVAWMGYYNLRVSGDPLTMPYALHTARYMAAPLFFWDPIPATPDYPNEQMRAFHTGMELHEYRDQADAYFIAAAWRLGMVVWGYVRPMLLFIPLAAGFAAMALSTRHRRAGVLAAAVCAAVLLAHLLSCPWMRLAYMAPLIGMLFVLLGIGMRSLDRLQIDGAPLGRVIVRSLIVAQLICGCWALFDYARRNANADIGARARLIHSLEAEPDQQLVFVRYTPDHSVAEEWVYNSPDLQQAKIIFARDLGADENRLLMQRFPDRRRWLVTVAPGRAAVAAYPAPAP